MNYISFERQPETAINLAQLGIYRNFSEKPGIKMKIAKFLKKLPLFASEWDIVEKRILLFPKGFVRLVDEGWPKGSPELIKNKRTVYETFFFMYTYELGPKMEAALKASNVTNKVAKLALKTFVQGVIEKPGDYRFADLVTNLGDKAFETGLDTATGGASSFEGSDAESLEKVGSEFGETWSDLPGALKNLVDKGNYSNVREGVTTIHGGLSAVDGATSSFDDATNSIKVAFGRGEEPPVTALFKLKKALQKELQALVSGKYRHIAVQQVTHLMRPKNNEPWFASRSSTIKVGETNIDVIEKIIEYKMKSYGWAKTPWASKENTHRTPDPFWYFRERSEIELKLRKESDPEVKLRPRRRQGQGGPYCADLPEVKVGDYSDGKPMRWVLWKQKDLQRAVPYLYIQ